MNTHNAELEPQNRILSSNYHAERRQKRATGNTDHDLQRGLKKPTEGKEGKKQSLEMFQDSNFHVYMMWKFIQLSWS